MVCLRNISVDTLHKGHTEDDDDDDDDDDDNDDDDDDNNNNNNNNNNNLFFRYVCWLWYQGFRLLRWQGWFIANWVSDWC